MLTEWLANIINKVHLYIFFAVAFLMQLTGETKRGKKYLISRITIMHHKCK